MGATARREFFKYALKGIAAAILVNYSPNAMPSESIFNVSPISSSQKKDPTTFLQEIYEEVQELGRYGNDNFIKREFHLNLDGDESNKEEHVVVLNHCAFGREIMLLQVTYFESRREKSPVKYAKMIREIECSVLDNGIEIQRCDYDKTEIRTLLPNLLRGIRETKKCLQLIR